MFRDLIVRSNYTYQSDLYTKENKNYNYIKKLLNVRHANTLLLLVYSRSTALSDGSEWVEVLYNDHCDHCEGDDPNAFVLKDHDGLLKFDDQY